MKKTESVKIKKEIIDLARDVKEETGVPIQIQFEKGWEEKYGKQKKEK